MNYGQIECAANTLRRGGVIGYPTESCFGLGCDPRNTDGVKRILKLKKRSREKGLILIADRFCRFVGYIKKLDPQIQEQSSATWPGPITWLVPAGNSTSQWLIGDRDTIGIRVTGHPFAAKICSQAAMAIVSTSANRACRPPLRTAHAVKQEFAGDIDFVVDLPIGSQANPSAIVHAITAEVIRT